MSKWQHVPLGECCEIVSGATPKTGVQEYWDGEILWATPKDLSNLPGAYIDDTPRRITQAGLRSCAATVLPAGSVLLSSRAPIGHVAINTKPMATNQGFKSLVPSKSRVDSKYLLYWLKANQRLLESLGNGATFKEISKKSVAKIEIPLPPLDEQRRIAAVLDKVDALRAKRREAIALLDDLTQSVFLDMFGDPVLNDRDWPRVSFGSLLQKVDSGQSPKCLARPAEEGEWGVLKLGAITQCEYLPNENKALPEGVEPHADKEVQVGDLLFSRKNTRELVAACVLVRETPRRLLLPDLMFRLILKNEAKIEKTYLHQLLINPKKRRAIQSLAGGSSGSMPNISKSRLVEIDIELPPLELQNQFAERVTAIESLKRKHLAHLTHLDELFASLQQRAFRGDLFSSPPRPHSGA